MWRKKAEALLAEQKLEETFGLAMSREEDLDILSRAQQHALRRDVLLKLTNRIFPSKLAAGVEVDAAATLALEQAKLMLETEWGNADVDPDTKACLEVVVPIRPRVD